MKHPQLYMTARMYALMTRLIIRASRPDLFLNLMDVSKLYNENVLWVWVWGGLNLVLLWYVDQVIDGTYQEDLVKQAA